jgi:hypothetical protein
MLLAEKMVFTIPAAVAAKIQRWKLHADQAWLREQLDEYGEVMVVRLGDTFGLHTITELPEPGVATPFYGDFGGGFPYVFAASKNSWLLRVDAPVAVAPFTVELDDLAGLEEASKAEVAEGILYDQPDSGNWCFGIAGEFLTRLRDWGWDKGVLRAYRYTFVPLSVGCIARVTDEVSGEMIDLTEDVQW